MSSFEKQKNFILILRKRDILKYFCTNTFFNFIMGIGVKAYRLRLRTFSSISCVNTVDLRKANFKNKRDNHKAHQKNIIKPKQILTRL